MKNWQFIITLLLAVVALVLSILAISRQQPLDIPAAVLSLVGICATLIVGVSLVDALVLHSAFQKVDNKMNEMSDKLKELKKIEDELRKMKKQSNILFHYTWGLTYCKEEPVAAFQEFWKALELTMKVDDIKRAKSCLQQAELLIDDIINNDSINANEELELLSVEFGTKIMSQNLKDTNVYHAFGDRIEKLIVRINNTYKSNNLQQ